MLRNAANHALHGDAHHRPWQPIEATPVHARLRLEAGRLPDLDFPFPFSVEVTYALDGATLRNELVLENTGRSRMPAGLGFHPYFVRAPDGGADDAEVTFRATGVYRASRHAPCCRRERLYRCRLRWTSLVRARSTSHSIIASRAGTALPTSCGGAVAMRAAIRASDRCRHLVVYSPPGQPFFAFEPVTNANDGFNLAARDVCGRGRRRTRTRRKAHCRLHADADRRPMNGVTAVDVLPFAVALGLGSSSVCSDSSRTRTSRASALSRW